MIIVKIDCISYTYLIYFWIFEMYFVFIVASYYGKLR